MHSKRYFFESCFGLRPVTIVIFFFSFHLWLGTLTWKSSFNADVTPDFADCSCFRHLFKSFGYVEWTWR